MEGLNFGDNQLKAVEVENFSNTETSQENTTAVAEAAVEIANIFRDRIPGAINRISENPYFKNLRNLEQF